MTPQQAKVVYLLKIWGPVIAFIFGAGAIWTRDRGDLANSVRVPRFEAESIRVHFDLDILRQTQSDVRAICQAVKARCQ